MNFYLIMSLMSFIGALFSAINGQKFWMVVNIFCLIYSLARGFGVI